MNAPRKVWRETERKIIKEVEDIELKESIKESVEID